MKFSRSEAPWMLLRSPKSLELLISRNAFVDFFQIGLKINAFFVESLSMHCQDVSESFEANTLSSKVISPQLSGRCQETFCSSKRELCGGRMFIADLRNAFLQSCYYFLGFNVSNEVNKAALLIFKVRFFRARCKIIKRLDCFGNALPLLSCEAHFVFKHNSSMLQRLQRHLVSQAFIGPNCSSQSTSRCGPPAECPNPTIVTSIKPGEVIELPASTIQDHPGNDQKYRDGGSNCEPNSRLFHTEANSTRQLSSGVVG